MNSDYWRSFWLEYTKFADDKDEHTQVLRIRDKNPISEELWHYTIQNVMSHLTPGADEDLLDLCSGNGLLSVAYSPLVKSVTAVELSPQLTAILSARNIANIKPISADIRDVVFADGSFSRVLWYAGIQYLDEHEIISMMRKIRGWLRPGGILFVGDIADRDKIWSYFNTPQRENAYFQSVEQRKAIIGSWLQKDWLAKLMSSCGYVGIDVIEQDPKLIYSDFRYDLKAKAPE